MLRIYGVYDKMASGFEQFFYEKTDNLARRVMSEIVADPRSKLNKYASDYQLFVLGEIDQASGEVLPLKPCFLSNASEFLQKTTLQPTEEKIDE